jgi:hypothetical protein
MTVETMGSDATLEGEGSGRTVGSAVVATAVIGSVALGAHAVKKKMMQAMTSSILVTFISVSGNASQLLPNCNCFYPELAAWFG